MGKMGIPFSVSEKVVEVHGNDSVSLLNEVNDSVIVEQEWCRWLLVEVVSGDGVGCSVRQDGEEPVMEILAMGERRVCVSVTEEGER